MVLRERGLVLDDVRLYNRALTDAELTNVFAQPQ